MSDNHAGAVYDLHSHSYFSDGSLSPEALIERAEQSGVSHLALSDHDTLTGLERAQAAAKETDVTVINSVELSCSWNGQLLHVVALNVDPTNQRLLDGVAQNRQRRLQRAELMHQDFAEHGIDLRELVAAQIHHGTVPTRPHFAQALIDQGLAKDKKQAFKRYLVPGKTGYIPMQWPAIEEIAEWINAANGVAVLAHPTRYKFTRTKLVRLINHMQAAGINAMEVSTPITNPQQQKMLADLCREFSLSASIGSDFHSPDQAWAKLGSAKPLAPDLTPVWESF